MQITPVIAPKSSPALKSRTSKVRTDKSVEPTNSTAPKKAKIAAAISPAAIEKSEPKKASSPVKSKANAQIVTHSTVAATTTMPEPTTYPSAEELSGMIAQAAFFIAAQRNFAPGNELDDWLQAEREIISRFPQ